MVASEAKNGFVERGINSSVRALWASKKRAPTVVAASRLTPESPTFLGKSHVSQQNSSFASKHLNLKAMEQTHCIVSDLPVCDLNRQTYA